MAQTSMYIDAFFVAAVGGKYLFDVFDVHFMFLPRPWNFIDSKILYRSREAYCETNPEVQYLKHPMHVIMLGHEGRHVSL